MLVIPEPGVLYSIVSDLVESLKDVLHSVKEYVRRKEIEGTIEGLESSLQALSSLAEEFAFAIKEGEDAEEWLLKNASEIMRVKLTLLPHLQKAFEVIPQLKGKTPDEVVEDMWKDVEDEDIRLLLELLRDAHVRGLDRYLQQNVENLSSEMLLTMINLSAIVDFLALVVMLSDDGKVALPDEGEVRRVFRKYLGDLSEFWGDVELLKSMEENETGELVSIDEIMSALRDEGVV